MVLSELLAGKEGFRLSAGGVCAERAAQRQLAGARLVGLQVGLDQVCQSLDTNNSADAEAAPKMDAPSANRSYDRM